jgi:general secretion pathway protein H
VRNTRGFTLLELMIVLLIGVTAFGAVALKAFSGDQTAKLQAAARDIASALRYAHGQALLIAAPVGVAVNLAENTYRITGEDRIYRLPSEMGVSVVVAEEELSAEGEGAIEFFQDGSSTGGRVVLQSGQQIRRIDVNWVTGEVSISNAPT